MNYKELDDPYEPILKGSGKRSKKVQPKNDNLVYQSLNVEMGSLYKPIKIDEVKLNDPYKDDEVVQGENVGPFLSYPQNPISYGVSQSLVLPKGFNNFQKLPQRQDYYARTLDNDLYTRTDLIGSIPPYSNEFDDYYEKLQATYFTPEIQDITFFFNDVSILGTTLTYRDAWGKSEKETYKGNLHLPSNMYPNSYQSKKIAFDFEDFLKEAYLEGEDRVTYLKLVSSKGKTIELGNHSGANLVNQIPELTRVIAFGGAYNDCLTGLYLYYM